MTEAYATLTEAIEIDPKRIRSYFELAYLQKASNGSEWLVERLQSLLCDSLGPVERGLLNYALGKIFDDFGQWGDAIQHFDQANDAMAGLLGQNQFFHSQASLYVDSLIQDFSGRFLDGFGEIYSDSSQPIFIVGMIRSGTTLVEKIVSSHADVQAGGELSYLPVHTRGILGDSNTVDSKQASQVIDGYLRLLGEIGKGRTRVTDKLPQNFYLVGVIRKLFPKAKIIHCKRNPLDTCFSIYVTPYNGPVRFAHIKRNSIENYLNYLRLASHWRRVLSGHAYLEVEYEALVYAPEGEIPKIFDFLGLQTQAQVLTPELSPGTVRTPSNWQVRQPIYTSSVGRWINYEPWLGEFSELKTIC